MTSPRTRIALIAFLFPLISACSSGPEVIEVFDHEGSSLGSVAIEATCTPEANENIRRGLALLHNMTYSAAIEEFAAATEADSSCAIARWGEATTLFHPLWPDVPSGEMFARGVTLLGEARTLEPTEIELAYINAADAYFSGGTSAKEIDRLKAYSAAWDDVVATHPEDVESKLFQVISRIAISGAASDRVAARAEAGEIAEGVLKNIPDHPGALHYTIHAFDLPQLADRALDDARVYGKVAPDNSHALHMTSHIFTRVGSWDESIDYNSKAAKAALKFRVGGAISMHHLHAADYLVYAYLQQGRDDAAANVYKEVMAISEPVQNHAGSAYAYAAIPVRQALERHDWEAAKAVAVESPSSIDWMNFPHIEAIVVFGQGMGAARTGDFNAAREASVRMKELETKAGELPGAYNWAEQVRIQRLAVEAWTAYESGDTELGLQLMTEAADLEESTTKNPVTPAEALPATELLGDMLTAANQSAEARAAYEKSLARNRNRLNSLYGAAQASEQMGDAEAANEFYRQITEFADRSSSLASITKAFEVVG